MMNKALVLYAKWTSLYIQYNAISRGVRRIDSSLEKCIFKPSESLLCNSFQS